MNKYSITFTLKTDEEITERYIGKYMANSVTDLLLQIVYNGLDIGLEKLNEEKINIIAMHIVEVEAEV